MFWDSSAVVPLAFQEPRSTELNGLLDAESRFTLWWATSIECAAAGYRGHRERRIDAATLKTGLAIVHELAAEAQIVAPTDAVRARAEVLLARHALRAADALQLAAALAWCEDQPWNESFVSLDTRLRAAAAHEGFTVVPADST